MRDYMTSLDNLLQQNFRLAVFSLLSAMLVICLTLFVIYRLLTQNYLMATVDIGILVMVVSVIVYAWRTKNMQYVGYFSAITNTSLSVALTMHLGVVGLFWLFPAIVANFFIINIRGAWILAFVSAAIVLLFTEVLHDTTEKLAFLTGFILLASYAAGFSFYNQRQRTVLQRQLDEIRANSQLQNALFEISEIAHSNYDINSILFDIHRIVNNLVYAENFYIALYNSSQDTVSFIYFVDSVDKELAAELRRPRPLSQFYQGLTWYVITKGLPLRGTLADIAAQLPGPLDDRGSKCAHWLGMPMLAQGKVVGAIVVQSYDANKTFSERDQTVLGFVADQIVTAYDRKRSREELESRVRERTQKLDQLIREQQAVFDNIPVGLLIATDGAIWRVNSRFNHIVGDSASVHAGQAVDGLLSNLKFTSEHLAGNPDLQAIVEGGEFEFERSDGERIWARVALSAIDMAGHHDSYIIVAEDMTTQKYLEQQVKQGLADALQAKEHAEFASRAKGDFLAMMSHEIRTPLAGVIGMQQIALRDKALRDTTRRQIEKAQTNAQSLLTIINDVLDLSKIEARKLELEATDFCLPELLQEAVDMLQEMAQAKNLHLRLQQDQALAKDVVGDPTRLRQVLVNLLSNAIKFTEQGHVELQAQFVSQQEHQQTIKFSVVDTGIGIASHALESLFESFVQADVSTTRRFGGTGLGLSISQHLVQLMGGKIHVSSEEHKGSCFWFTLQLPLGTARPQQQEQPLSPHSHRLKILCAEDFPTNQIIIQTLLEDMGHKVVMVENGEQALDALTHRTFDLVLMDGRMPLMDGYTASQLIRQGGTEQWPVLQPNIPIIALTANVTAEDRQRCLDCGMNAFLSKPIDERQLHLTLQQSIIQLLQQGQNLEPLIHSSIDSLDALFNIQPSASSAINVASIPAQPTTKPSLSERLRSAYYEDLPKRLQELQQALDSKNLPQLAHLFHGIKGSAGFLEPGGQLYLLAAALEQAADEGDWTRIVQERQRILRLMQHIGEEPSAAIHETRDEEVNE